MEPRYAVIPLLAAIFTPLLVHLSLETFVRTGRAPPFAPPPPGLDPLVVLVTAIPFVALIVCVWIASLQNARRVESMFWGELTAVWGFMAYANWNLMYPFYAGQHVSSTHALGIFAAVFWGCLIMPLGLLIGWGISLLARFVTRER
jgi:hypothetical protein